MNRANRIPLFDRWTADYDRLVRKNKDFPFDGYDRLLHAIVEAADVVAGMEVLDLGTGTGNLAALFARAGCRVSGVDVSPKMLAKARRNVPEASFYEADATRELPSGLLRGFDRIVSSYFFHEFDLSTKVSIVERLVCRHLNPGGRIVIGDVAFPTTVEQAAAALRWSTAWDFDQFYWSADESKEALNAIGLSVGYRQISSCGGLFVIEPIPAPNERAIAATESSPDTDENVHWYEGNAEQVGDVVACRYCDGSGECPYCRPNDGHDCFKCGFTRACAWCGGSGRVVVVRREGDRSYFEKV